MRCLALALLFVAVGSWSASAATLNIIGGQLLGASGVIVGGDLYNVEFVDGTCIDLFNGCDEGADFTFNTTADALLAAQALLDQVFVDDLAPDFLDLDSIPGLTNGCSSAISTCFVDIPYAALTYGDRVTFLLYARNRNATNPMDDEALDPINNLLDAAADTSAMPGGDGVVYARWSAVPEPSIAFTLGMGLISLGAYRRREA